MAFTSQDLAAIDAAIASGELTIRSGNDGRMVTLRSMDELIKARDTIQDELARTAATAPRLYPRHQLADFSD